MQARKQYEYANSKIGLEKIIEGIQEWINTQGLSTELSTENGWHKIKVVKGKAIWKGQCEIYIQGNPERFCVIIDTGKVSLGGFWVNRNRGLPIVMAAQALDKISEISGAKKIDEKLLEFSKKPFFKSS